MMQYEIEESKGFGSTWIKVIGKNAKQETMTIEIVHCENPGGKNSLPYAWYKNGWTDKVMETYIGCHTYVHDSEGNCFGIYNPSTKLSEDGKRSVINFDWLLEDTEENQKKIIEACIKLFESATGKSATEKKIEHVMEFAKEKGLEVVSEMPKDWRKNPFATDPYGAVTIDNGKPFFANHKRNPEYKRMLLMEGV